LLLLKLNNYLTPITERKKHTYVQRDSDSSQNGQWEGGLEVVRVTGVLLEWH